MLAEWPLARACAVDANPNIRAALAEPISNVTLDGRIETFITFPPLLPRHAIRAALSSGAEAPSRRPPLPCSFRARLQKIAKCCWSLQERISQTPLRNLILEEFIAAL